MDQERYFPRLPATTTGKQYRPFRERVFSSLNVPAICKENVSRFVQPKPTARPAQYRLNWNEQTMKTALDAVIHGGMSVSRASHTHNVPKSTLYDHSNGKVLPGVRSGPPTILTDEEEEDLVSFLIESAEIGYPKSRLDVIAMAQKAVAKKGVVGELTNGWWQGFCKRHPILSLKTATTLSTARAKASSSESIKKYFTLSDETLNRYELNDDPALIFNMDESGFPMDPKPLKGVFVRGERNPCSVSAGTKSQITVVACVSAAGQCLPPMIVWPRKTMNPELAIGEVPGTVYGLAERGWMTQHLFKRWFKRHFLRYAPAARPLLLLLDGHSSHYCPETLKLAEEEDVIIFALPPNTTHLTQPLDKGVFGPLKVRWRQVVHDFRVSHPGQVVTQYNFCRLISKAWVESMTPLNISSGFKTTGIHPLNHDVLKLPCQIKSDSKFIDRQYLPAFTPAKREVISKVSLLDQDASFCISAVGSIHTLLDSPLTSVSDYHQIERQNTMKMMNIEDVKLRQFKPKPMKLKPDSSGRVLTSSECLRDIEEKKRKKEEAREAKEQRKQQREQKRKEKVISKASKKPLSSTVTVRWRDDDDVIVDLAKDEEWLPSVSQISLSPSDLTTWIGSLGLTVEDKKILTGGRCLTAKHIGAVNQLLKLQFPMQTGLQDTHYLQVRKVWTSNPQDFVQVIYVDPAHWACLSNIACEEGSVDLYDSMTTIPTEDGSIVQQACTILKSLNLSVVKINVINVKQQVGDTDCGLFAVAMAMDLCLNINPFCESYVQDKMRLHLEMCFENQIMTHFPCVDRAITSKMKRVWRTVPVEVQTMISCDRCDVWYGTDCVVDEDLDLTSSAEWFCPSCQDGRDLSPTSTCTKTGLKKPSAAVNAGRGKSLRSKKAGSTIDLKGQDGLSPSDTELPELSSSSSAIKGQDGRDLSPTSTCTKTGLKKPSAAVNAGRGKSLRSKKAGSTIDLKGIVL